MNELNSLPAHLERFLMDRLRELFDGAHMGQEDLQQ
jgi:hypothetical protein